MLQGQECQGRVRIPHQGARRQLSMGRGPWSADGSWHWARQHGVASRDQNGRAYRVSGSTGDITAEKRLAEELDRIRRQLEDALESIAEGFVLFDPQDRLVMCNSHYRSWFTDVAHLVRPGNTF